MNDGVQFREDDFTLWLQTSLREHDFLPKSEGDFTLLPLSGDAGFRRYFRLNTSEPLLAVYAPPDTEDSRAFTKINEFLRKQHVRAPLIIASDLSKGYLLVEDLGSSLLLAHLNESDVDTLYSQALLLLLRIQQSPLDYSVFPRYDKQKLRAEMNLFPEWFVEKQLGLTLSDSERQLIEATFDMLERSAEEQPQVVVHRDFHSRNLIFSNDGNFGVIDFQDAVIGPLTYDLVSLLKDCYIEWPDERVERWMSAYANLAIEVGITPAVSKEKFKRWFVWMGLQRHIKVLGIFCRLSLRDKKHHYLHDLPLVVRYVRSALEQYPEFADFSLWFEKTLMPIINKQSWMLDALKESQS